MVGQDTRTGEEKRKGRRQRYVHAGFRPNWDRGPKNQFPADFRFKGVRANVKGGRWGVRKLATYRPDGRYWEAYCRGTAKALGGRFATQAEAFSHAESVAKTDERAEEMSETQTPLSSASVMCWVGERECGQHREFILMVIVAVGDMFVPIMIPLGVL